MNYEELSEWNSKMRNRAISYLNSQGIDAPNVGECPAFEIAPHFGIWCVESKKQAGKIGWWIFAGDCPTDYVYEKGECHPRSALRDLVTAWKSYIPHMKNGKQPPETTFGDGSNIKELGNLLEKRVNILEDWLDDNDLWENR
jgi:hypothetical protein